jgi:SSS family solute:Na+ symporter
MAASASLIFLQKSLFPSLSPAQALGFDILACFLVTLSIGFACKPTDMEILVEFYSRIRPFGFWGPVRKEAIRRGFVPARDPMPAFDALNGLLTAVFQLSLALIPFYCFLRRWNQALIWSIIAVVLGIILYFTWYKNLPSREEA